MRVAIFFDGPNFYRNLESTRPDLEIDYDRLAGWILDRVAPDSGQLIGAWYHTGLHDQPTLDRFLKGLELRPGYYVRRHRVVERSVTCGHCRQATVTRVEKGVDTAIAVDMVRMAARGILDRVVLLSGDADLLPAVVAVQEMGHPVWLASWGALGQASALRAAAYGHIDLLEGVEDFSTGRRRVVGSPVVAETFDSEHARVMEQVRLAASYFEERNGHLSRWYFENRWDAVGAELPQGVARRDAVEELLARGELELYEATINGRQMTALRPASDGSSTR